MINYMVDSCETLGESEIARAETILRVVLPAAYKNFLRLHNGGRPHPDSFPIENEQIRTQGKIDFFLCVKDGNLYNLTTWVNRYKTRVPKELIPVAIDPGGNLICLGVKGQYMEEVFFWDHENEAPEGEQAWFKNLYLVANSFDEFINRFE